MWLLIVLAVLILLFLVVTYITFFITFYSPKKDRAYVMDAPRGEDYKVHEERFKGLINEFKEIPFEEVYITANDGMLLYARYYHVKDGAPIQIQCHGYRGSGLRDFCGGNKIAREMGHNTLVIDQRAQGKSGGTVITFGIKERHDVLCWINYVNERFGKDTPIILCGVSMGGATVLMTTDQNLPENVLGVVADCPFSKPEAIIAKVIKDMKLPPKLLMPFIVLGAKLYGGFNLKEASAIKSVRSAKIPILIIHGEEDGFVPCYMSDDMYNLAPNNITYERFPKANHGLSYMADTQRYKKAIKDFIEGCLEKVTKL